MNNLKKAQQNRERWLVPAAADADESEPIIMHLSGAEFHIPAVSIGAVIAALIAT